MVFIKLVALILVFGSSGVGLLSVRQSRLQAAHEMAEARLESRRLDERAGELRAKIAELCTPERVTGLLNPEIGYAQAIDHRADIVFGEIPEFTGLGSDPSQAELQWMDEAFRAEHAWILNDGSRVILIDD
jgi:hypothetical protein